MTEDNDYACCDNCMRLIHELEATRKERDRLNDEVTTLRRMPIGEVWYWQGDEYDHPESLACPVIMEPDVLRQMLRKVAAWEQERGDV